MVLGVKNSSNTANPSHSPLASSMFTPGVSDILEEFGSSSTMMASFLVSIYVLGYVVGPFIIAPLSELYGRVPLYHTCNALLLVFMIACAVSQSLGQLLAFRLLAGIAGVCPLTIGSEFFQDVYLPLNHTPASSTTTAPPPSPARPSTLTAPCSRVPH